MKIISAVFLRLYIFFIYLNIRMNCVIFTALHGLAYDENSVRLCLSNACIVIKRKKKICSDFYTYKRTFSLVSTVSPLSVSAARIPIFEVSRNGIPVCTALQTSAGVSLQTSVRSEVARLSPELRTRVLTEVGFSPTVAQRLVSRAVVNNEPSYNAFSGEVLASSVVSSVPVATSHLQYRHQLSPVASNAVNVKCRENRSEHRSQSVTPEVGRRVSVNVSQQVYGVIVMLK